MKKKTLLILLGLAIAAGSAALIFRQRGPAAALQIEVVPSDSVITLDGKKVSEGLVKVKPGPHKLVFSRDGFETQTKDVRVPEGKEEYAGVVLRSNSPRTANWYEANPKDAKKAEGIASRAFDVKARTKTEAMPILKELPWIDRLYRVDYGGSQNDPADPAKTALYITYYSAEGKTQALEWLKFKGHTPEDTEMIFTKAD